MHQSTNIQPRLIRFRDAPKYLGMDRNRFSKEVRPFITEIRIGIQGIAFDRHELDEWVDNYKQHNGRPGRPIGDNIWDAKRAQVSSNAVKSGMSTKGSGVCELPNLLELAASKKRKNS